MIVDRFSKELVLFLITKNFSALDLVQGFCNHIWKCHDTPQSVLSNQGMQFTSSFTQALNKLLGVKSILSSPYHLQTDGQTECTQQTWQRYLHAYTTEDKY